MSDTYSVDLPEEAFVTRGGDVASYSMSPTQEMRFLFSGSVGQPDFFEERSNRGDSPPMHRHPWATWEYVLAGRLRIVVDGVEYQASQGEVFHTPPNSAHTFVIESDTAHVIGFNCPGGYFERLYQDVIPHLAGPEPDMEVAAKEAARIGVEVVGPPLEPSSSDEP